MASPKPVRQLIVNADDFGRSQGINQAVIRAHQEGILTTASLMVNGEACAEAVALAKQNPRLGVGLHLTLVCGRATLPFHLIPDLVNSNGEFSCAPIRTGFRYFADVGLLYQLQREIQAQFEKFDRTGLRLDHVNGHLNLHLHPTVFCLLAHFARSWDIHHFRLTHDPLWLNLRLARGQWLYRLSHAFIFNRLVKHARPMLQRLHIRHTDAVFGLLQTGRVTESYALALLPQLPPGVSELYCHPALQQVPDELATLVSPRVKSLIQQLNIELIRYQDLK